MLQAGHAMEAITDCTEVLKNGNPNDLHALCDRAEAYLLNEQYDEGTFIFLHFVYVVLCLFGFYSFFVQQSKTIVLL